MGLLGVDTRALGMLSALRQCFGLLKDHRGDEWTLAAAPQEDQPTWAMSRRADTRGVFQIESHVQRAMLPRLNPRTFYDLMIEEAIVRPGPIRGAWSISLCDGGTARKRSAIRRRWNASSAGSWVHMGFGSYRFPESHAACFALLTYARCWRTCPQARQQWSTNAPI